MGPWQYLESIPVASQCPPVHRWQSAQSRNNLQSVPGYGMLVTTSEPGGEYGIVSRGFATVSGSEVASLCFCSVCWLPDNPSQSTCAQCSACKTPGVQASVCWLPDNPSQSTCAEYSACRQESHTRHPSIWQAKALLVWLYHRSEHTAKQSTPVAGWDRW